MFEAIQPLDIYNKNINILIGSGDLDPPSPNSFCILS